MSELWKRIKNISEFFSNGLCNKNISSCIEYDSIQDWVFDRQSPLWISQFKRLMPQSRNSFFTQRLYNIPNSVKTSREILIWLRKNEFNGHLQRILLKVDRASMAHGIEVRVPFLDRKIINFSTLIRPELGISHRNTKYLLKNILKNMFQKIFIFKIKKDFRLIWNGY